MSSKKTLNAAVQIRSVARSAAEELGFVFKHVEVKTRADMVGTKWKIIGHGEYVVMGEVYRPKNPDSTTWFGYILDPEPGMLRLDPAKVLYDYGLLNLNITLPLGWFTPELTPA